MRFLGFGVGKKIHVTRFGEVGCRTLLYDLETVDSQYLIGGIVILRKRCLASTGPRR